MHCFYCEANNVAGEQITITGSDVNHIKNVLRMERGEELMVCDGTGMQYTCQIADFPAGDKMKLIRDERARELAGELHRKYDLVRWGIWHTETKKYVPDQEDKDGTKEDVKEPLYDNIEKFKEYCPIPDTECALTIDPMTGVPALDNPAYAGVEVEVGDDNNIE